MASMHTYNGFILFIVALVPSQGFDNATNPYYCIFIALWATVYIEMWKRRNAEISMLWDLVDYEEKERVRPSFIGEEKYGAYVDGTFIELEQEIGKPTPPKVLYSSPNARLIKMGVGAGIIATMITTVVIATFGIFIFRVFISEIQHTFGGIVAGIVNAITIMLFSMGYRTVAKKLTDWENHRTESEYENNLIIKNFIFQFVNSYISLFYIAFLKENVDLFGFPRTPCSPDCMTELAVQLGTIFITSTSIQQANEVGIPWLRLKVELYLETRKIKKATHEEVEAASQAEEQSKGTAYTSTFDDYNEMAIQFGYVTLFAAAFPAAPFAALINNLVEARTDLVKLFKGMQRPHPREAANIGTWLEILEAISYLATITNSAIIVFTSTELDILYPNITPMTKLWIALIAEHVIFILKFLIQKFIPDAPAWVKEEWARKTYYKSLMAEAHKHEEMNESKEELDYDDTKIPESETPKTPLVSLEY